MENKKFEGLEKVIANEIRNTLKDYADNEVYVLDIANSIYDSNRLDTISVFFTAQDVLGQLASVENHYDDELTEEIADEIISEINKML